MKESVFDIFYKGKKQQKKKKKMCLNRGRSLQEVIDLLILTRDLKIVIVYCNITVISSFQCKKYIFRPYSCFVARLKKRELNIK